MFQLFSEYLQKPSETGCFKCSGQKAVKLVKKRLPILQWLPNYTGGCNINPTSSIKGKY